MRKSVINGIILANGKFHFFLLQVSIEIHVVNDQFQHDYMNFFII